VGDDVTVESRLTDVEESLRLLRDANRWQGRRISAAAPSPGAVYRWNNTTSKFEPVPGVTILDRDLDTVNVANKTDETSIYSYSIGANVLGATGGVRLVMGGEYLNNSGATRTLQFKVKLGSTTIFTTNAFDITLSTNNRAWEMTVWFLNSAAAAQKWGAFFQLSPAGAERFTIQPVSGTAMPDGVGWFSSSEDTTGALTLDITAKHSFAHGSLAITREMALLELLAAA
jgi:hypothetical protein